ncbi:hypothetical protein RDWZM_005660 [Blomia tropicalis]|uniref:Uncharacterized protein n=1 Tax=Blomia tropicalis TaxID=40697 RepID=A0A9Q0RL21_BLOTA|nr:hypothetical protein RDWZM_005660 [Blomia tropicalis]
MLGSEAIKAAVKMSEIPVDEVDELQMGNVLSAGTGQHPSRQAALWAGMPLDLPTSSVNKVGSSGLKSIMLMAQAIKCGTIDTAIAGGFESMSNVPFYIRREKIPLGGCQLMDGLVVDASTDVYYKFHMGTCAEHIAVKLGITREDQDQYAIESYKKCAKYSELMTKMEITPVEIPATETEPAKIVVEDEEFRQLNIEQLNTLPPMYQKEFGTITIGNSATPNDGAAATVIASGKTVKQHNLKPLARIVAFADAEVDPVDFPLAPTFAIPKVLNLAGIKKEQITMWEINEPFSVTALANIKIMEIDPQLVNIHGGSISLGHPLGMTGTRLVNKLSLYMKSGEYGLASCCNGGGGASAILVQKI